MKLGELLRDLISDDCETEKTVLTLLLIYFIFLNIEKKHDESIKHDYKPTFILCSSVITEMWWLKYLLYFSSLLTIKVWYDDWGDSKNPVMHNAILEKNVQDLHDYVCGLDSNNLNTTWVIIVLSYTTAQSHSLKTYMVESSEKEKKKQAVIRIRDQGSATESEEGGESDQKEVNESIKYSMILRGLFKRLILNKCYKVKNQSLKIFWFISLLNIPHKWFFLITLMSNSIMNLLTPLTLLWISEWESDKIKYKLFEICKHDDDDDDHRDNSNSEDSGDEANSEAVTIVTASHNQLDSQVFQSCIWQRNIEIKEVKWILSSILHQIQLWQTMTSKMMMNSEII